MGFQHQFDPTVLREYDIRGIVGRTLHKADAFAIGRAFGTVVARTGGMRVAVGYDGRLSSPDLEPELVAGLKASGMEVLRVGRGPTPMLYYAATTLQTDGAVMVTGSHNPPDYNGFKMMLGRKPFFGTQIQDIGTIAGSGDVVPEAAGSDRAVDVAADYVARLIADWDGGDRILDVVWDNGNGAAGEMLQRLVAALPGKHTVLNGDIDGRFPAHHPDPTVAKNLEQLIAEVRRSGADIGVAFDGDADRIGVVDDEGEILFASPLAGEMSGHIFYAENWYGFDDALYAAVRVLGIVARLDCKLSDIRKALPQVINTPELRFDCADTRKFGVIEEVAGRLREAGARVADIDGVRVQTEDGWWLLRASNTQAVLVARAEASSEAGLERLKAALVEQLEASGIEAPDFSGENAGH